MFKRAAFGISLFLGLGAAFGGPAGSPPPATPDAGEVLLESVDGSAPVEVEKGTIWSPAQVGDTIHSGQSVRTGSSSARLVYADGSVVALSTQTEVNLVPDPKPVIELVRGTVWGQIAKTPAATPGVAKKTDPRIRIVTNPSPPPSAGAGVAATTEPPVYKFTLRTKSVVMGVRGTEFLVESGANGETAVDTLDGTVDTAPDLKTLHEGRGVPVHQGERIRATAGTPFGHAEAFKAEELTARLQKNHPGLVRFLKKPVSADRPGRGRKRTFEQAEERRKERTDSTDDSTRRVAPTRRR